MRARGAVASQSADVQNRRRQEERPVYIQSPHSYICLDLGGGDACAILTRVAGTGLGLADFAELGPWVMRR